MLPGYRFSNFVKMVLFKTVPGRESQVATLLRQTIDREGSGRLYLVFGDYDLLVITEETEAASFTSNDPLLADGALPYILGAREVVCFGVHRSDQSSSQSKPLPSILNMMGNGPVFCASFIRTEGFFSRAWGRDEASGLFPEQQFLDAYFRSAHEAHGDALLSTLGGPEFVLLKSGSSIQSVYQWLGSLRSTFRGLGKSFSIVGIGDCISTQSKLSTTNGTRSLGTCGKQLRLDLRAACKGDGYDDVHAKLASAFGDYEIDCAYVPGIDDIAATINLGENDSLERVIDAVMRFRKSAGDLLVSTTTVFYNHNVKQPLRKSQQGSTAPVEPPPLPEHPPHSQRQLPGLMIDADFATAILNSANMPAPISRIAIRALYGYGDLLQNPLLYDDLVDMLRYFWTLKFQLEEIIHPSPQAESPELKVAHLMARLVPAHMGVDQRTIGSQAGINAVETNVRQHIGGIHRVIQAAEAIPLAMFGALRRSRLDAQAKRRTQWPGFVVIGAFGELFNAFHEVYLPIHIMWEPNLWVGLIHEAAHCIIRQDGRRFAFTNTDFEEALKNCAPYRAAGGTLQKKLIEKLLVELLADAIGLAFSPFWEPELVFSGFWDEQRTQFSQEALAAPDLRLAPYLLRASTLGTCAEALCAHFQPEIASSRRGERTLGPVLAHSVDAARAHRDRLRAHYGEERLEFFMEEYEAIADCAKTFALTLLTGPENIRPNDRISWWFSEAEDVCLEIENGCPVSPKRIRFPELLLWKLFERHPRAERAAGNERSAAMTKRQRAAAMISLVGCFREEILHYRD